MCLNSNLPCLINDPDEGSDSALLRMMEGGERGEQQRYQVYLDPGLRQGERGMQPDQGKRWRRGGGEVKEEVIPVCSVQGRGAD